MQNEGSKQAKKSVRRLIMRSKDYDTFIANYDTLIELLHKDFSLMLDHDIKKSKEGPMENTLFNFLKKFKI